MIDVNTRVIELVQETVRNHASAEIPCFDELCAGLGVKVEERPLPLGRDGMQIEKTVIINSRIQSEARKQFTRFHELMHYLLNEEGELLSALHDATWNQKGEFERQVERHCNFGAAEFLMPRAVLMKLAQNVGFHVRLIPIAAEHFGSSAIAMTLQLAHVAPYACLTAVCEPGGGPNQTPLVPVSLLDGGSRSRKQMLRVVYTASSAATKYRLAKDTRIPCDHLIYRAFLQARMLEGESRVPFRSGKHPPCYCEALPIGNSVYVLFHLRSRPAAAHPHQLTLWHASG